MEILSSREQMKEGYDSKKHQLEKKEVVKAGGEENDTEELKKGLIMSYTKNDLDNILKKYRVHEKILERSTSFMSGFGKWVNSEMESIKKI